MWKLVVRQDGGCSGWWWANVGEMDVRAGGEGDRGGAASLACCVTGDVALMIGGCKQWNASLQRPIGFGVFARIKQQLGRKGD